MEHGGIEETTPASRVRGEIRLMRIQNRERNWALDLIGTVLLGLGVPLILRSYVSPTVLLAWAVGYGVMVIISAAGIGFFARDTYDWDGPFDRLWTAGTGFFVALTPWLSPELRSDDGAAAVLMALGIAVVSSDALFMPQAKNSTWRLASVLEMSSIALALCLGGHWFMAAVVVGFGFHMLSGAKAIEQVVTELIGARLKSDDRADTATTEALVDPLTQRANRRALELAIDDLLASDANSITCAFLDLDDLKQVNDLFGHGIGDNAIVGAADHIHTTLGPAWQLARIGGDEFVAVSALDGAKGQLVDLVDFTVEVDPVSHQQLQLSMTIGVTELPVRGATRSKLLHEAGSAMRYAKTSNKGQVVEADNDLRETFDARMRLASQVEQALTNRQITAWGQTIHDATTGRIVGVECLARWVREDGTIEPPDHFVPIIEQKGLSARLGLSILEQALAFVHDIESATGECPYVSVNISAGHFASGMLVPQIAAAITRSRVDPRHLVIEVTESQNLLELRGWEQTAQRLRNLGVGLAIDDFGSGYSSISELITLPVDYLKIDRTLTTACKNEAGATLLRGVVEFADSTGLTTVGEGVESEEELEALRAVGINVVQGWLFSKAEPLAVVAEHIHAQNDNDIQTKWNETEPQPDLDVAPVTPMVPVADIDTYQP
jgi:diguanylate cyclase (GGDEF)-like protein